MTNETRAAHTPTQSDPIWMRFIKLGSEAEQAERYTAMYDALDELLYVYGHPAKLTPEQKMNAVHKARAALTAAKGD